jgi:hypothetical protein
MRITSPFATLRAFATSAFAVTAITLALSAVPARADIITETYSATSVTSNLGLLPFNPALGTLTSVGYTFSLGGSVPFNSPGGAAINVDSLIDASTSISNCDLAAGCPLRFSGSGSSTSSTTLADMSAPFTQTFTTNGTVTGPSVSGTVTFTFTPVSAVPEPASIGLLLTLIGLVAGKMVQKLKASA